MDRITDKQLKALVERINRITGSPERAYVTVDGRNVAQVGNYHLDWAYSGVSLARMCNESGGITKPLGHGYGTKRECYEQLRAFIAGFEATKN